MNRRVGINEQVGISIPLAGPLDEAELLYRKVWRIRHRVLGEKHPDTQESVKNLIDLYEDWKKPGEANKWRAKLPQTEAVEE